MTDLLALLDRERRALGEPDAAGRVVREWSADGSECRIVSSRCTAEDVDAVVGEEVARADAARCVLEWKVYDSDGPPDLERHLLAAGFEPGPAEAVLVLALDAPPTSDAPTSDAPGYDIERVGVDGLADVAAISREIGRTDVADESRRRAAVLRDAPDTMSVHVARLDGVPVACGRTHFAPGSAVAELAGGRTRTTHRRRGLFTALVTARLAEARSRGRSHALVDALPTSEPVLRRLGFRSVARTRPYVRRPDLGFESQL